ncbi:hypothetical protein K3495_g6794 [Podosphaera aphanis]|nr:hypothetical protein K3495_g6794 [Podosphaera aphanis]
MTHTVQKNLDDPGTETTVIAELLGQVALAGEEDQDVSLDDIEKAFDDLLPEESSDNFDEYFDFTAYDLDQNAPMMNEITKVETTNDVHLEEQQIFNVDDILNEFENRY